MTALLATLMLVAQPAPLSLDQVRAAPPLWPLPLVVLSADRPRGLQVRLMVARGETAG